MMDMKALSERFLQQTARIESLLCLAGMIGEYDEMAEPLSDLLEVPPQCLRACFPDIPRYVEAALDEGIDEDGAGKFAEWCVTSGKLGFVLQIGTPMMRPLKGGSGHTWSWGVVRSTWVYGDTFDEAVERGFEWVAKQRAAEAADAQAA